MIYIDGEKRMSQMAADTATVLGLIQEILRAGTGHEVGMSRDRRDQSASTPVHVPAGTGSSAVGKVTLTQSLLEPARAPERVGSSALAPADAPTVQRKLDHDASEPSASAAASRPSYDLASLFGRPTREPVVPVQRQASSPSEPTAVSQIAAQGVAGAGEALPHFSHIQASFGHHDVSGVRAHRGPAATAATHELGARAYAAGNAVAFGGQPDLHTAAHEAAHLVQQRGGVQLKGGIDQPGDAYEQHADAVADAVVAGQSAAPLLDQLAGRGGNHDVAVQRAPAPASAAAAANPATQPGMWEHAFGEASTPVGKLGRVQATKGVFLRERPLPGAPSPSAPVPFNGLVFVERRTSQGAANERWCYVIATELGTAGFCEERYLAIDPPEPTATLHPTAPGERLATIAENAYGPAKDDNNSRLYVQALYLANRDRAGVKLDHVDLSFKDRALRGEDERRTLEVYKGAKVIAGDSIWIPGKPFIEQLKAAGAVTGGSTLITEAWDSAKDAVGAVVDVAKYVAGFFVGLLEGAYNAVVDLFKGAADMVEAVLKIIWNVVSGNPGRVKEMAAGWVEKMKAVWEHRGEIADEFLKKWNAESAWDRGLFQGEVLGWVTMTVLLILVTMGEDAPAALAGIAARWPQLIKLLKTVDTLGDVTTYLGAAAKVAKLPAKATRFVAGKFGRAERAAEHLAEDVAQDAARVGTKAENTASHAGHAGHDEARAIERDKPAMETTSKPLENGAELSMDFVRDLSPTARGIVRKLEKNGWVRVSEIAKDDLVQISKWFEKEIGVVQSPYGRLRVILGTRDGILLNQLKAGEVFVVHTHPVLRSVPGHFKKDLEKAGKHIEAVVDWNGTVIYFSKAGIKNPRNPGGWLEPLLDYEAAFMDGSGNIVGFSKVDLIDGAGGVTVKVRP